MGLFPRIGSGRINATSNANARANKAARRDDRWNWLSPSALMRRVGLTGTNAGSVDSLEKRELLFTLAITQDQVDPATGLGTARAYFGYVIPWLAKDYDVPDVTAQTVTENYNQQPYITVGSGTILNQSNFQILHNIVPVSDVIITSDTGAVDQNQERFLRVDLNQSGEFIEFRPRSGATGQFRRPSTRVEFAIRPNQTAGNISDNSGLDTDNTIVQLIYNNAVVSSFTGQALRNANIAPTGNPFNGSGTYAFNAPQGTQFDSVRILLNGTFSLAGSSAFEVDDMAFTFPNSRFAAGIEPNIFGAAIALTGPVGASVSIRDVQGADMVRTIALGRPQGSEVLLVDPNDNGPDFNDGIGSISFNNVDGRTSFAMIGGRITANPNPDGTEDFAQGGFILNLVGNINAGFANEFEQAGFGYTYTINNGQNFGVSGVPPAAGSVIIGSPWIRNSGNYFPTGFGSGGVFAADDAVVEPDGNTSFIRADQGIFVPNGQSMNSIHIHGILHGNSQFTGYVNQMSVSYLVGSITVAGDLGSLTTQTDAGAWSPDTDFVNQIPNVTLDQAYRTEGTVTVGRTVGEIAIGGRGQADITVIGDLNSPVTRPARDILNYTEREYVQPFGQNTQQLTLNRDWFNNLGASSFVDPGSLVRNANRASLFGGGFLRNNTLMTAEYVGNAGTSVRIRGDLSGANPVQTEDRSDVYSFYWDGTTEISVQSTVDFAGFGTHFRIVDSQGRTIGTPEAIDPETIAGDPNNRRRFNSSSVRVKPREGPGLYYVVVSDPNGNDTGIATTGYTLVITGMGSTTFGSYRTGGGSGFATTNGGLANAITVLSGGVGAIQIGAGYGGNNGADAASATLSNIAPNFTEDDFASLAGGSFTINGDLGAIIAGSDIGAPRNVGLQSIINFDVSGRVGNISTGLSPLYGNGPRGFQGSNVGGDGAGAEGDVNDLVMRVRGGGVGSIDIGGGIGMDQDVENANRRSATGTGFRLQTGDNVRGIAGDIGSIRIGFHVLGTAVGNTPFNIETSDNSTIGSLLISQDAYEDADPRSGIYGGIMRLRTGINSDIRFLDIPEIDIVGDDSVFFLVPGQVREFIDDGGARVSISVTGTGLGSVGTVRVVPVDGGQGVAIAQIVVDLTGGQTLNINGTSQGISDLISLGRIRVTGDENSRIEIGGNAEIDVYRIEVTGAVQTVRNATPRGDILTLDAESVDEVIIEGDLGRTQLVPYGPQSIAVFAGVNGDGLNDTLGGPVGTSGGDQNQILVDDDYNGDVYRPANNDNFVAGAAYRDDLGSPVDGRLEGLIVRGGNVSRVTVKGAVYNIILQDDAGVLGEVVINSDGITPVDQFEGLLGTIYANRVALVDVGDGIASRIDDNPMGAPGIYAADDIGTVTGPRSVTVPGGGAGGGNSVKATQVQGVITAGNVTGGNIGTVVLRNGFTYDFATDGINNIILPGGSFVDSYISVDTLDSFWTSFEYGEQRFFYGDIGLINVADANFTRNRISALNVPSFQGEGVIFDATRMVVGGNLGTMTVKGFSNTTLLGTAEEFIPTDIRVERDINTITATEDVLDASITNTGDFTGTFTARNIVRSRLQTSGRLTTVTTTQDVRGSDIQAGELNTLTVGRNIASSNVAVSGRIQTIAIADRAINTAVEVTGPDGNIQAITAVNGFQGRIISSGRINQVSVTAGDFDAEVTTTETDGDLTTLTASRDVILSGNIKGNLGTVTAGRHLGSLSKSGQALVVQGNITTLTATGALYNDYRAGGTIGTVTLGGAVSKPNNDQTGRGSLVAFNGITSVIVNNGDFGGDILSYSNGIGTVTINGGSFLPDRTIGAYRGSITALTINGGDLLGNVYADDDIVALVVNAGTGTQGPGPFGNIGIDNAKNSGTNVNARRNQLPQGVTAKSGIEGSLIRAGRDITSITITGSVFESGFHAGRNITNIAIGGRVTNNSDFGSKGSFFAAGDSIVRVSAGINIADTTFIAGLTSLGADNRAGGQGANADTVKSGSIGTVISPAGAFGVTFVAGASAGNNGVYGDNLGTPGDESLDDALALGVSTIGTLNIGGSIANGQVIADVIPTSVANDNRFAIKRIPGQLQSYVLDSGTGFAGTQFSGTQNVSVGSATYTINFTGPGQAFYTLGTPGGILSNGLGQPDFTITLRNTTATSAFTVSSSSGTLENFHLWTNNNASLATLNINSILSGNSTILVDGGAATVRGTTTARTANNFETYRPRIDIGGDIATFTFAGFADGFVNARNIAALSITGDFGSGAGSASIQALSMGTIAITGANRGLLSSDTNITQITNTGAGERALIRAGRSIGPITFGGQFSRSTISAGRDIGAVAIGGQMFDSSISAGADLGRDGFFGGTGLNADSLRSGSIGNITVGGNFLESDITAGYLRGPDGFFGTNDDLFAGGRGSIGTVAILGTQTGSTRSGETYRIASNGTLGAVTLGTLAFTGIRNNFGLLTPLAAPRAIEIDTLRVTVDSFIPSAVIEFNQPMDFSSLPSALSVAEVRGQGEVEIGLVRGLDYTLSYSEAKNALIVTFSRALISANLPVVPGRPGPGVYRLRLDAATARGRLQDAPFDGNGDGLAGSTDDYAGAVVIGDAGDKITAETVSSNGRSYDFYAPANLNFILDNANAPDSLPEPNRTFTVDGFIGDHPDNNTTDFRLGGDVDLYTITVQAGQILRLSAIRGGAAAAQYRVRDAAGNLVDLLNASDLTVSLPVPDVNTPFETSAQQSYLFKQTGTYIISVGAADNIATAGVVNNPAQTVPGSIGNYSFDVQIFDDGDSGFNSTSRAGDGTNVIPAPLPIDFAGNDGVFNTPDDQATIEIADYVFTLNRGTDGSPNTGDDVVSGTNSDGVTSSRSGSTTTQRVVSAIGNRNFIGVPSVFTSDVDVFHLNNRQGIAPGTKMKMTLKLSATGSDLGSLSIPTTQDLRGYVQFALFETTGATNENSSIDDANLVFSASDFRPYGGTPNTLVADNGSTKYGYDANGDFYIEFVTPAAQGTTDGAGTFAAYVQGIINSDYELEIVTGGTGSTVRQQQRIYLETSGGTVDWLQTGNRITQLTGFDVKTLGITGSATNGQPMQTYILNNLVSQLNSLYQSAGLDVVFSANANDFEFTEFSTIYLSSTLDPVNPIFSTFTAFNFLSLAQGNFNQLFNPTQPYGVAERSDPFNARLDDEAVIFVPSFGLIGRTPGQADVDLLIENMTAAVARRAGEMMGVRLTQNDTPNNLGGQFDPFAANSVDFGIDPAVRDFNPDYRITNLSRGLSGSSDTVTQTNFFLGRQSGLNLLKNNLRQR
ncbi:MAG: hypothetical protein U0640_01650 [Phycisphaerales bacterium]